MNKRIALFLLFTIVLKLPLAASLIGDSVLATSVITYRNSTFSTFMQTPQIVNNSSTPEYSEFLTNLPIGSFEYSVDIQQSAVRFDMQIVGNEELEFDFLIENLNWVNELGEPIEGIIIDANFSDLNGYFENANLEFTESSIRVTNPASNMSGSTTVLLDVFHEGPNVIIPEPKMYAILGFFLFILSVIGRVSQKKSEI